LANKGSGFPEPFFVGETAFAGAQLTKESRSRDVASANWPITIDLIRLGRNPPLPRRDPV